MFLGTFEHNLDDKLRMTIPSKLRNKLGNVIFVSKGFEGSLELRSALAFDQWVQKIMEFSNLKSDARLLGRTILGNSSEIEIDSAGRIKIPTILLNQVGIKKNVYIIGVGDHLEVWDKEKYEKYVLETNESYEEIVDNLESYGA